MSNSALPINFNNTEKAFAYKTDSDLKRARLLFSAMQFAPLVKLGTKITPWAIKSGLPVKGIIKSTLFQQFVGGESLEETVGVADMLEKFNVQVVLDYGVEGGEGDEGGRGRGRGRGRGGYRRYRPRYVRRGGARGVGGRGNVIARFEDPGATVCSRGTGFGTMEEVGGLRRSCADGRWRAKPTDDLVARFSAND